MAPFEDAPASGIQTDKLAVQRSFMPSFASKAFKLSNSELTVRFRREISWQCLSSMYASARKASRSNSNT
jgi:hypothetical protein